MDLQPKNDCASDQGQQRSAGALNQSCSCITLDREALFQAIENEIGDPETSRLVAETRPHLFSDVSVFLSSADFERMTAAVSSIEKIAHLPNYRAAALSWAPQVAAVDHGPAGVLMGYDFHVASDGPKLIEINTNAGGAFLNALLTTAQRACCPEPLRQAMVAKADGFEVATVEMFQTEWKRQRTGQPLTRVAIVDDAPTTQYLYPEMVLAQRLFLRRGIDAVIVDAKDLILKGNRLHCDSGPIDLVYNRLVDFSLGLPEHSVLRQAYIEGAVVLTPNPHVHALLADKRNLTLLSDPATLHAWGVEEHDVARLRETIPHTVQITADNAEQLWHERKRFFFKPAAGHGSKGAYRGEKLTKATWAAILQGTYLAQAFASPGQRSINVDGVSTTLKVDIRLYTYAGQLLLAAARLYQGQTTNFRTLGGGFAPVFAVPSPSAST